MISRVFDFMKKTKTINLKNKPFLNFPTKHKPPHDVFINHRGTDTKRNIASLLYDNLRGRNVRPFLDIKSLKLGDKLFDRINGAILSSKVAVTIFSPNYGESYSCLDELALILESKKRVVPIFFDIKPSELDVMIDKSKCSDDQIQRFRWALQEAKEIVGVSFDSCKGNLSDVVTIASNAIVETLVELEDEDENA